MDWFFFSDLVEKVLRLKLDFERGESLRNEIFGRLRVILVTRNTVKSIWDQGREKEVEILKELLVVGLSGTFPFLSDCR